VRARDRTGEAYLSPMGFLYVVVSEPWISPFVSETEWLHDVVVFGCDVEASVVVRCESTVAELGTRLGWSRLA